MRPVIALFALAALATPVVAQLQPARPRFPTDSTRLASVTDLPLIEVGNPSPGQWLAVVLTGDGGWARGVRELAGTFRNAGVAVVGLDSRAYLSRPRTPDDIGADVERVIRYYVRRWNTPRVVLIGYSRGADLAPFVASRFSPDVRERVALVAMLGLGTHLGLRFHWSDVAFDIRRPDDLATLPEVARVTGVRMLCIYGTEEKESGCRGIDPGLVTSMARPGGHDFNGDFRALARIVLAALGGG